MRVTINRSTVYLLAAVFALPVAGSLLAEQQTSPQSDITVTGQPLPDLATLPVGPDIKGIISARNADRVRVTAADGRKTIVIVTAATVIKSSSGLFGIGGGTKPGPEALINGLPVTVKTRQSGGQLFASQISFRNSDLKFASMIQNGTDQRFAEQSAATEALRSRVGDIDNYNIKSTTNVMFDSGKADLSVRAKADLCAAAAQAEATNNALLLVVGYTDSTGSQELNQALSERRAARVINYLQQACHWKPWRMLTPTGMAMADPLASNATPEGKAQNRRVAVNILVSKAVDGM